ncbi:MAG: nucleotidyltransferase domain-containing protein [bacterium]
MTDTGGKPDADILNEIVKRIVEAVRPVRVVLFGSASRGQMGPDSDLDLMIVMPDGIHRRQTARTIYRSLAGIGVAKDIVVVTESDIRNHQDNPSLVIYPALREGRELLPCRSIDPLKGLRLAWPRPQFTSQAVRDSQKEPHTFHSSIHKKYSCRQIFSPNGKCL